MNTTSAQIDGKRSLLQIDRTLHLLDVENLCGTPAFTEDDLMDLQRRYTDLVPIGPSDLVVLAASHFRDRELLFGWTDARHLFRSGPDGADKRLLEVINNEGVAERFPRIVIGSGDGIFQPACERLEAHQTKVTIVSRSLRSTARSLQFTVNEILILSRPLATHPGPSRRITVEPLRRPRRFPDRPDPKPRRNPAQPPPGGTDSPAGAPVITIKNLLFTEPVLGIRRWEVSEKSNWELLQGYGDTIWATNGEFTEAECKAGAVPGDETHAGKAPSGRCSCGLYAVHPFEAAARHHNLEYVFHKQLGASGFPGCHNHPRTTRVFGVIEATGQIEVHEHGFRAEFARPIGLLLPARDPHRYHVLDLCRRYRACRIDSLLGETLESFVAKRSGLLTEHAVGALLEPVRRAEKELAAANAKALEEQATVAMPLSWRLREALPAPVYWTGSFVFHLACAILGITIWLIVILAWILPILGLAQAIT